MKVKQTKYRHIFSAFTLLCTITLNAQQDAGYSYYMVNTLAVNPAYVGIHNALSVTALHRSQWLGFEGAPTMESLSTHLPILKNNAGIGLSIVSDRFAYISTNSMDANFAYRIKIEKGKHLQLGIKAGINYRKVDFTSIPLENPNDPDFLGANASSLLPNIGFGFLYVSRKFYAGLSAPKILENDFDPINSRRTSISGERRHFYLIGGYLHEINRDWKLKSSALVRVTRFAPIVADLSGQFIYNDKFLAGPTFRLGDAAGFMVAYKFYNNLQMGYAFDFSYKNLTGQYNYGSHELMLNYVIPGTEKGICPAYF